MSELYSVRVAARPDDRTVDLDIKVVHPDAMHIPESPGFALMLLHDRASGDAPLARELDLQTVMNSEWASANARAFVESVELLSSKNEPPPEALDDYDHRYWKNSAKWLEGRLRIRATHPAWVSHVPRSWDSAAFDPASDYEPSPPARPDEQHAIVLETDFERSEGFMPAPRLMIASEVGADCPEVIWIPRYGAQAYEAHERRSGIDITIVALREWMGRPLIWRIEGDDTRVGIVAKIEDGRVALVSISSGGRSTRWSDPSGLSWIGLAAFRRGTPRLAPPLSLERMLAHANPAALVERVDGREVTVKIHVLAADPGMQRPLTAANVLRLLALPARPSWSDFDGATAKLGLALQRQMQTRGMSWDTELYSIVALGFIESYQAETPERPRAVDLDEVERSQAIEFIEQRRWPSFTVTAVVTDAAWLEHLEHAGPWSVDSEQLEPPQAWDEDPVTWDPALARDEDDDNDNDDEPEVTTSTLRRRFELPGPVTKFTATGDDPRSVLRDHGMWEFVQHPEARDNFEAACKLGNVEVVRAYVALGIDVNSHTDISGETPLIRAAEGNQPEVIRVLAEAGADLQGKDGGGDTAIMTAVNWNTPAALRALIEVGADPDVPDNYENYPLVKAVEEGHDDLVEILLEGGASLDAGANTRDSALQWCVHNNSERLRELLARQGADVNQVNSMGDTLLHLAVVHEQDDAAAALIEAGADLSRRNRWGWTARDVAEVNNAHGIAEQLDEAGAQLTMGDAAALFRAVADGDRDGVIAALDRGLDVDTRNPQGQTALLCAISGGHLELAELLRSRGADINARDAHENNALEYADSTDARRWLLQNGVEAAYRDSKGVLQQPGVEAVIEEDDHELLAVLLDARTNFSDLSDLSACHLSLIWGDFEDRLKQRAETLRILGRAGADLDAPAPGEGTSLLMGYINRGHEPPAMALLEVGVNLEHEDKNHTTALIKACSEYSNHDECARITRALLAAKADYTKTDWLGRSAWDSAESVSNQECVDALEQVFAQTLRDALAECGRDEDSDPEDLDAAVFEALARRSNQETLLHWVRKREHAIVRGLLQAGFDPNPPQRNRHGLRPGNLPLTAAISAGDVAMVEILLAGGADPNLVQSYGSTALSYAVSESGGNVEMVRLLLAAKANPMPVDDSGHTPLSTPAAHGNIAILELLLEAGASVQPFASGYLPLHAAVRNGSFEGTQWLLAHGADIDARDEGRETPLHVAIERDQIEIALALIAAGADPNVQTSDEHRITPLIRATKSGNVELIEALLAAGADPHVKDADGQSAIDHASYREELRVLFPEAGEAPRFERVERELPPLLRAVHLGDREAFTQALAEADDIDVSNYRGDTALMLAIMFGQRHMVEALLEAGANVAAANAKGDTPWTYAFTSGREELRLLLEERGATTSMDALNQMAAQSMRHDAVMQAIRAGDVARVAKHIDELDFDVDLLGRVRPLGVAIDRGDVALIQLLLAKGADASLDAGGGQSLRERGEAAGFGALFE
ncbi:MAG TPA: ankyrin repeat domain-containing protein [Enhygromyxa sp.]|nr:ankyrin repeat domain-containing protein [Enhygromyxa sp.]